MEINVKVGFISSIMSRLMAKVKGIRRVYAENWMRFLRTSNLSGAPKMEREMEKRKYRAKR